jgi:toxin CptA
VSSRIELAIAPSATVGVLAATPWLILLAFVTVAGVAGKFWLLAALPFAAAGALAQYRHTGLLRSARSVTALIVDNNQCHARMADNQIIPVRVCAGSRLGSRLTLLKLRPQGTRLLTCSSMLLANTANISGNVAEDDFRRLRVWLRLGRSQSTPA